MIFAYISTYELTTQFDNIYLLHLKKSPMRVCIYTRTIIVYFYELYKTKYNEIGYNEHYF